MLALYRTLLWLYPAGYRDQFGEEMIAVFRRADTDTRAKKLAAYAAFCLRECAGLLRGALREQLQHFTGLDSTSLFPLRRFTMRCEFRFPLSTWILMTLILAGVIMAIEKAGAITASLPRSNPHLPPIQPVHYVFLPPFVAMFLVVYLLAALAWTVLFALRRSGMHRLSKLDTAPHQE